MEFGQISDNPFAPKSRPAARPNRRAFGSAIKFLLLVAVCLAGTLVITTQSRRWLVQQLTADFASLSPEAKQARLIQLADLGTAGIEPLVAAMADPEHEVARSAYELLLESQANWKQLGRSRRQRHQQSLVESLRTAAVQLPDDRTGWGAHLLQQAVLADTVRRDQESLRLHRQAGEVIDRLSLTERAGPSVLSRGDSVSEPPRRVAARQRLMRVPNDEAGAANTGGVTNGRATASPQPEADTEPDATDSIYRSGGSVRLRPTDSDQPVVLRAVAESRQARPLAPIHSVTHLVDSPLESLDDPSVMKFLGSPHSALRQQAEAELHRRGFDRAQVSIASRLAAGDTTARLQMIDTIARADRIDPRPWLLMLLDDPNSRIKLRAVSVLATMNDAYIDQRLRAHAASEPNATIAGQIREMVDRR